MNDPVKLALVGCGGVSHAHVKGYLDLWKHGCNSFRVTAVCDPVRELAEQRASEISFHGDMDIFIYTDIAQMIADGVADAADICLPHYLHHSVGIQLLSGGLHVMIEKPIGITIKATRQIIEAGHNHGKVVATAEHTRRGAGARAAQWAIRQRKMIGEIRDVAVQYTKPELPNYDLPMMKWRGFKKTAGGGMLLDSGAHFADMMICLFGTPDIVDCTMSTSDHRMIKGVPVFGDVEMDVEDTFTAHLIFPDSLDVIWTYSSAEGIPETNYGEYQGREGKMVDHDFVMHPLQYGGEIIFDGHPPVTLHPNQIYDQYIHALTPEQIDRVFPFGCQDGFAIEVWDFIDAIQTDRSPEIDGYTGLAAKAICMACYESATAGKPVSYSDVLNGKIDAYQKPINNVWNIK